MSCLTDFELLVTCCECKEKNDLVGGNIEFYCDDCKENLETNPGKKFTGQLIEELIESFEENKKRHIKFDEYTGFCGFKSEDDKRIFLWGVKMGVEDSILEIITLAEEYGFNYWEKLNQMKAGWKDQQVDSQLSRLDKFRCDKCDGQGFIE